MYTLSPLPFAYDSIKNVLSPEILELHHDKHHQIYVDKLNAALGAHPELFDRSVIDLVRNYKTLPADIQTPVRNFGGGVYNHDLFWSFITPESTKISDELAAAIDQKFGSLQNFKNEFSTRATTLFGSGWVWLLADLSIVTTPNQDNPISDGAADPILCVDVWEHAYYVDYTFKRADFIAAWWQVVNWDEVNRRYLEFK